MRGVFLLITASLLIYTGIVRGQSGYRSKIVGTGNDTVQIDTLSIVPGSLQLLFLSGETVPADFYRVNYPNAELIWMQRPGSSSVKIIYQVFPLLLTKKYFLKDPALITEGTIKNQEFIYQAPQKENSLFEFRDLNKSGSISRSVGFGNSRDLSVNSSMALQLSGMLSRDIEITAAISDDNIPIQPEGRTQQLNEFDKVFVQLKRRSTSLIAGDFEISRPDSYFMNFYKRTQGILISSSFKKNDWTYSTSTAAAIAKGRSARNSFQGNEGNQGPYRLRGNNGEQYIIVLSGTERVYIDGELIYRGEENDYVIDYNAAEISFTSKRLITRNSRIIVEFEYSDKNYARTLTYFNQEASGKKLAFRFNFYNEQDNPNQPFLQDISEAQKNHLKSIGNQLEKAMFPNVDTVAFNPDEVLYKQIDTLGMKAFVYSIDPGAAIYRPGFAFVGPGNGDYKLSTTSAANGRVFEFIAPENGLKQGDHAPVTMLVVPKKQQLLTFAADYQAGRRTFITSEIAFSNNDVNLFSSLGDAENKGIAYRFTIKNELPFSKTDSTGLKLLTGANYEYAAAEFKAVERYRPVEFERDFNLSGLTASSAEYLTGFNVGLFKSEQRKLDYGFNSFSKGGQYTGYRQRLAGTYQYRTYQLSYQGSVLNSYSNFEKGSFYKQKAGLRRTFGLWSAGIVYEQEDNQVMQETSQDLSPLSFAFNQYKIYTDYNSESDGSNFNFEFSRRYDKLPEGKRLENLSKADIYSMSYKTTKNPNSLLQLTSAFRRLKYSETALQQDERMLLGRADYQLNLMKGLINSAVFYEFGSGQEAKKEFIYFEVPAGQGAYTWNDYNQNGIKELDEFELAQYADQAVFIRINRPSNEFIKVNNTSYNQTVRLLPATLLTDAWGVQKLFSKLSAQTAVKIDRKTAGRIEMSAFNPFSHIPEESLVSLSSFLKNTIFFNRNNPFFGIDVNFQKTRSKLLLLNGFDSRDRREEGLRLRLEPLKKTTLIVEGNKGMKTYGSELFSQKNYRISFMEIRPRVNIQLSSHLRLSFEGGFTSQKNQLELGGEKNKNFIFGTEARYHILKKSVLTSDINLLNNSFKGAAGSAVAYEMLNGLNPGRNVVLNAAFRHSLVNGIQLNFNYQGRKSDAVRMIHTAGAEVRAFF